MSKISKIIIWTIAILVVVWAVWFLANKPQPALGGPIKVGVMLPQTGDTSVSGEKIFKGVQLAAQKLPRDKVQFFYEDTNSKAATAVTVAQKLINIDKVNIIIGPYIPDETLAVAPVLAGKGIDVFNFSLCVDDFKKYDFLFCGYPSAQKQLETVIPKIRQLGVKTIALIDQNSVFGISSRGAMKSLSNEGNYNVVFDELVQGGQGDYRTVIAKALQTKPDAVFTTTDDPLDALNIAKQAKELSFKGARITFIDVDNKNLQSFGSSVENTYAPGIAPSNFSSDFTNAYKQAYNQDPDYLAATGYDVVNYIWGAIQANNGSTVNLTQTVINYALPNPAMSGFKFLPDRTVNFYMELWQVKNGQYSKAQ